MKQQVAVLGLGRFGQAVARELTTHGHDVLATVLVKQLGVKRIIAKAANALHGSILEQVGASRVVYPERETGLRVAHSFAAPGVRDYLDVAPGYGFARVPVSDALA